MDREKVLFTQGRVIDGTGKPSVVGNVLVEEGTIRYVGTEECAAARVVDCAGKVIAPGFIDAHSHMDWFMASDDPSFTAPFIAQGITTFVAGNCGFGVAGFRRDTAHRDRITNNLFKAGGTGRSWRQMSDYFSALDAAGVNNNLITLAGHGTTRASICGFRPGPLDAGETDELLHLLEEALDQGACGVSLGLQYEPGVFADVDELEKVAALVKRKDKILTVHGRAYSALSGTYPLRPFGTPHNLKAIEEMLGVAERTGVRLQYSHLIFVGEKTWATFERAMALLEQARARGIDVMTDCFASECGASQINVIFPAWFLARLPRAYDDRMALLRLRAEIYLMSTLLGFGYDDIQIAHAVDPHLSAYNGRTIAEIAERTGRAAFDVLIEIARRSGGSARILAHRYLNPQLAAALITHKATLFMTDAWYEPEGLQNPALYGGFPRILQMNRERRLLPLEEAVHKMTGATAERFSIKDRGILRQGLAADITVFDPEAIRDNTTKAATNAAPDGIHCVMINGAVVYDKNTGHKGRRAGVCLRR